MKWKKKRESKGIGERCVKDQKTGSGDRFGNKTF